MAYKAAHLAQVWFNGYDLSPYLNSAELSLDTDTGDTTTFSSSAYKTALPTLAGATLTTAGYFDATEDGILYAQLGVDGGVVTFCPAGGYAIGDRSRILLATTTNYAQSKAVDGIVAFSWTALAESAVGFGDVLHPLGVDTNTTTGAEKDDTAATTSGWTAALHVTGVSAGSWIVKLQDAAVSNTYSDVTGGAFTAATGATSQRLVSATGATLRRYVRYVATRTGGTAGDTITFALSYARSV